MRVRRAHFARPSIDGTRTGIVCRYTMHACMHLHPCASGYTDEPIADAGPPHTRAHVLRPCARVRGRSGAHPSAPTHASVFPSAWTAGGSARRRSPMRRRSTRTSHRGTPPRSPRCPMYAPPFRARAARHRRRDALGGVVDAARAVVRGGDRRCALARVCADVWACAGVHVCMYSWLRVAKTGCMYLCVYVCMYLYYKYV